MDDVLKFAIAGISAGAVYAIAASGLVVTYTTSGIFNFAHGAIGMLAAFTYWQFRVHWDWPTPLALAVVVLVLAPLLGALIERTMLRGLQGASLATTLTVTVGLMVFLIGVGQWLWPPESRNLLGFFGEDGFRMAGIKVLWHQVITVGVAIAVAFGLRFLLFRTRLGVAMRAQVDDRVLTSLNGAQPERVALASWALGSMLAALSGVLLASVLQLNVLPLTLLVVNGYAAAMVGRLKSLPLTFLGAVALGLVESFAIGNLPSEGIWSNAKAAIPILFLFIVLLALPEERLQVGRLARVAPNRVPSWAMSAIGAAALVGVVWFITASIAEGNITRLSLGLATGLVMLSLVPLVGYGGQVSLCQMTFAGIGAFVVSKWGTSGEPWAFLAAALVTGVVGAIVALPALRLQGLYLALSTMAFALLAERVFFSDTRVFGSAGTAEIVRFKIPGVSLASERSYAVFLAVAFALLGFGVLALRRSSWGRRLIAMKDSPAACATLGMNLRWTKLLLFGFSAALAGLAGALYGGVNQSAGTNDFVMLQSLVVLLPVVIWSIATVSGALAGGLSLAMLLPMLGEKYPWLPSELPLLATGLGAVGLGRRPDGIVLDLSHRLNSELAPARAAADAERALSQVHALVQESM